jgi:hypothetical protein
MRHPFAVAPRSDALHGRGDKVTASSGVFQLSFNHGLHHNSAYSQTTAPDALRVGSDATRILAQFHIQIMTQDIDYNILLGFCPPSKPRQFRITLLMNQLAI